METRSHPPPPKVAAEDTGYHMRQALILGHWSVLFCSLNLLQKSAHGSSEATKGQAEEAERRAA